MASLHALMQPPVWKQSGDVLSSTLEQRQTAHNKERAKHYRASTTEYLLHTVSTQPLGSWTGSGGRGKQGNQHPAPVLQGFLHLMAPAVLNVSKSWKPSAQARQPTQPSLHGSPDFPVTAVLLHCGIAAGVIVQQDAKCTD